MSEFVQPELKTSIARSYCKFVTSLDSSCRHVYPSGQGRRYGAGEGLHSVPRLVRHVILRDRMWEAGREEDRAEEKEQPRSIYVGGGGCPHRPEHLCRRDLDHFVALQGVVVRGIPAGAFLNVEDRSLRWQRHASSGLDLTEGEALDG